MCKGLNAGVKVFMITVMVLVNPCSAYCAHTTHLTPVFPSEWIFLCFWYRSLKQYIFLEDDIVCVLFKIASLPGIVSLSVFAFSQKPESLALPSWTPAISGCCPLEI